MVPGAWGRPHREHGRLVFGYEEALGYSVGDDRGVLVNDKDGIGAALAVAALAADAKRDGRTLLDLLDAQARRYGLHATSQLSVRVDDLSLIAAAMARLRAAPRASWAGVPSSRSTTSRSRRAGSRRPTGCGSAWRAGRGW